MYNILNATCFALLLYLIVEDVRKTYVEDKYVYAFFFLCLLKAILEGKYLSILAGLIIFLGFYALYRGGVMGDADGYVVGGVIFSIGLKKFALLFPLSAFIAGEFALYLSYRKAREKRALIYLTLALLSFLLVNLYLALTIITLGLLSLYRESKPFYEKVRGREVLPLDTISINGKEYLVVDERYKNIRHDRKISIKDLNPSEVYQRKIPIPFLVSLLPQLLAYLIPIDVSKMGCLLLMPLVNCLANFITA